MFKYNELSDLLSGELVTPLYKKNEDFIICLDSNGNKKEYSFDDFDFDKTVEERIFIVDTDDDFNSVTSSSNYSITDNNDNNEVEDNIENDNREDIDNSEDIAEEIIKISTTEKQWISYDNEKREILNKFGYTATNIKNVNILREDINL